LLSGVEWFGIDYAFTIMNPLTLHHSKVIPEMYRRMGRTEEGRERLARWYRLRDSMGNPTDPPHQKVRLMKEYHRDEMLAKVFDDDPRAKALYAEMEARERRPPDDLKVGLECLMSHGKTMSVVSEVIGAQGAMTVGSTLRAHGLTGYFEEVVTPSGRFSPTGEFLGEGGFVGSTKKEGTLYDRLAAYLDSRGIGPGKRAMVGDDTKLDVEFSKKRGFVSVQYTGIIDRGRSVHADYTLASWSEICKLL
jgi:phosphoglycolate phosphatase-like HAD superfamily hydrolase